MALEVQGYWWNVGSPVFDAGRWHGIYGSRSVENQTQELLVFRGGDSIHKVNESKKKTKSKKQPER